MELDEIKRGLRAEIKKREKETYATCQTNVRDMCNDVLKKLEEQENEIAELNAKLESVQNTAFTESVDVLVTDNRNLLDKVKKLENLLRENAEHFKRNEAQILENSDKVIADKDKEIAELIKQVHDYAQGLYVIQARAEKEARRQKYKRCLLRSVIAQMNATHYKDIFYDAGSEELADAYNRQITIHYKWQKLWLELAEKFKEA